MIVRIIKSDLRLRVKEGEIYYAQVYRFDPAKITLLKRIPDGHDPECNQYRDEVQILCSHVHEVD